MNNQKKNLRISSILFVLIFSTFEATAQDSLVKNLKEITISATKAEKNLFDAGRSVSIITAEDISNANYTSFSELLSHEAGIYIPGTGQTPGSNQSIFLRGANSNQTAIYIDGIRVTDASTVNNVMDLSEISLYDIEKIEILRGSHSTLYGSSAIGGVINLSTRKQGRKGFSSNGGISTGTFGSKTMIINPFSNMNYTFSNGIYICGTIDYSKVDGLDATTDTIHDPTIFKNRDMDDWSKLNTGFNVGYNKNKLEAILSYNYTESNTDIDRSAFIDDENYILDFTRSRLSGSLSQEFNRGISFSLVGGISWTERHAINDSSITSNVPEYDHKFTEDNYSGKTSNVDLVIKRKRKHWDLLLGFAHTADAMSSKNYYYSAFYFTPFPPTIYEGSTSVKSPNNETSSIYAQIDLKGILLSDKLSRFNLVAGLRYDYNNIFLEHLSYEINPSWNFGRRSLIYFSHSTGYNSPSLYQMYANSSYQPWDGGQESGISLGNTSLQPEKSYCTELGFKQKISSSGIFTAAIFNRIVNDNIEYANLWNKSVDIDSIGTDFNRDDYRGDAYVNAGKSTSFGIELRIEYQLINSLRCGAGLSFVEGETIYNEVYDPEGKFSSVNVQLFNNGYFLNTGNKKQEGLTKRPHTLRAELLYTGIKKLRINLISQYVGDRDDLFYDSEIKPQGALNTIKVKNYVLLDLNISYRLGKHLQLSSKIGNILDEQYSEIRGYSTRGRSLYFKLAYQL